MVHESPDQSAWLRPEEHISICCTEGPSYPELLTARLPGGRENTIIARLAVAWAWRFQNLSRPQQHLYASFCHNPQSNPEATTSPHARGGGLDALRPSGSP